MAELIIAEKPSAAKKIAEGLADSKPQKITEKGVNYYKVLHDSKEILVVSAVGHLFTVAEKEKSYKYPSFDIEWVASHKKNKDASYTKKYLDVIKKISKEADSFTVACDYDVEGEVIGFNVIRFICKQKDANRMKFSTLVKEDVKKAYQNKSPHIDWGLAKAGETRHFLDWLYGINLSRALTLAIKRAGSFKIMSSGRVQGPALKIIVKREKEIKEFKPEDFWQLFLLSGNLKASHEADKIFDEKKAADIYAKIKDEKKATISDVNSREYKQKPPTPFDLGSLQSEAYKLFNIDPKLTLQIAQNLYLKGITSYPRTSSQQLPPKIGYKKILGLLSKQPEYQGLSEFLLNKGSLKPNNGKKKDPAHPAIYPTGLSGSSLKDKDKKVYDLIVKRFFATFGDDALRETQNIKISCKEELFLTKASRTKIKGWHTLYSPYVKFKEEEFPQFKKDQVIDVDSIDLEKKQTEPPKRYTPASLISELEKRGLGTKATRADIVQHLFERGYLDGRSIEATELGILLVDVLDKYCPEILDDELTKKFEEEMDLISHKKVTSEEVLDNAHEFLKKVLSNFKEKEKEIGEEFIVANKETLDHQNTLGPCPKCKEGKLKIRRGKYGSFAACDKYPDCKTTFSLPKGVMIKPTTKVSDSGYPIVLVINKGKRPQEISLNHEDNIPEDKKELVKKLEKEGYTDPNDGTEMVLKYGFYGPFLAAKNYPKEKKILSLDQVQSL